MINLTKEQFEQKKKNNKIFSLISEFRGDDITPIMIYSGLKEQGKFILEGGTKGDSFGRYSFIGEKEMAVIGIRADKNALFTQHRWSGNHIPNGILMMKGKDIQTNHKVDGAEITDIAPTILALLPLSIPDDMDGTVLGGALQESFLHSNPIEFHKSNEQPLEDTPIGKGYSEEESEEVREKLQSLGYIE